MLRPQRQRSRRPPARGREPIRRYRQPEPPRPSTGRLIGKVFGWIVLGAARGRLGARRRALPVRPRDAERDRAALEGREVASKELGESAAAVAAGHRAR